MLKAGRRWPRADLDKFIAEYPTTPVRVLSERYGRSARSIASTASRLKLRQTYETKAAIGKASRLGKTGRRNGYRLWSDHDRETTLALYGVIPTKKLAEITQRSMSSVRALVMRTKKVLESA